MQTAMECCRVRWLLLCVSVVFLAVRATAADGGPCLGSFRIMGNIKISPIAAVLSKDGYIFLMDRSDLRDSRLLMPDNTSAHAVRYLIRTNIWVPILTATNTLCSAGGFLPDGTIINTAGNDWGLRSVRLMRPCSTSWRRYINGAGPPVCNTWWEDGKKLRLNATRWYPSMQVLPDKRFIVVGGSERSLGSANVDSYEYVDPVHQSVDRTYSLPFLKAAEPNYLYPSVHLLPCYKLFIFANTRGIIFDYLTDSVWMDVPTIPDNISRSYPSTAGVLLLPLTHTTSYKRAEILMCGGNVVELNSSTPATKSCWIIDVSSDLILAKAKLPWRGPYNLARGRVIPDVFYLMDGSIVVISGIQSGHAGFGTGANPNFWPEVLRLNAQRGIDVQSNYCPSTIARGYHSSAILVPDGRVFLSGSNPNGRYVHNPRYTFPSEFRIEMWRPPYVTQREFPRIIIRDYTRSVMYGQKFTINVEFPTVPSPLQNSANFGVALLAPAFVTHSQSMNVRYITLPFLVRWMASGMNCTLSPTAPPGPAVAPHGPYMLAVTYNNIPAVAPFIMLT